MRMSAHGANPLKGRGDRRCSEPEVLCYVVASEGHGIVCPVAQQRGSGRTSAGCTCKIFELDCD